MVSQITIRFLSSTSEVVYEETFNVRELFGVLIRQAVSELVGRKIIKAGEYYHSFIVPRYDGNSHFGEESVRIDPTSLPDISTGHPSLGWGAPEQLRGEPFRFFTLILRTVPRGLVYRRDWPLDELDPVLNNLEQQLVKRGKITRRDAKQGIRREMIARVKESEQETTSTLYILQPNVDDIDLNIDSEIDRDFDITLESIDEELPQRSFDEYNQNQLQKLITINNVKILVPTDVWKRVSGLAKLNRDVIKSGLLVGDVYKMHEEIYIVELFKLVPLSVSGVNKDQTYDTWLHTIQEQKGLLTDKRIIGFYRTNQVGPVLTLNDVFVQKNFFSSPWQVFLSVGSSVEHISFYCWHNQEVVVCHDCYLYEPNESEVKDANR